MPSIVWDAKFTGFLTQVPAYVMVDRAASYKAIYEEHRHRIFNFAFYLTDNEIVAEKLTTQVFSRTLAETKSPSAEFLDRALVSELRSTTAPEIGHLTLDENDACTSTQNARGNLKRAVLERAVVSIPHTERMIFLMHDVEGYDVSRIARTLDLNTDEVKNGLHQARLALRKAVAKIKY